MPNCRLKADVSLVARVHSAHATKRPAEGCNELCASVLITHITIASGSEYYTASRVCHWFRCKQCYSNELNIVLWKKMVTKFQAYNWASGQWRNDRGAEGAVAPGRSKRGTQNRGCKSGFYAIC